MVYPLKDHTVVFLPLKCLIQFDHLRVVVAVLLSEELEDLFFGFCAVHIPLYSSDDLNIKAHLPSWRKIFGPPGS